MTIAVQDTKVRTIRLFRVFLGFQAGQGECDRVRGPIESARSKRVSVFQLGGDNTMATRKERGWCVAERRPTGPDKIFYVSPAFRTREEAEEEKNRLAALPEKSDCRLEVTIQPEDRPRQKRQPSSNRKTCWVLHSIWQSSLSAHCLG